MRWLRRWRGDGLTAAAALVVVVCVAACRVELEGREGGEGGDGAVPGDGFGEGVAVLVVMLKWWR